MKEGEIIDIKKIEGEYELKIIDNINISLLHLDKNKILDKIKELKIFHHEIL